MRFNKGCTQLGRAISSVVELAVEINFVDDTVKHISGTQKFAAFTRTKTYSAFVSSMRSNLVYSEDLDTFDTCFCAENVVTPLCDGESVVECELRMTTGADGEPVWYSATFLRVDYSIDFNGNVVLILSDINHHKEVEARAEQLSQWVERDPLTGLYNKKAAQTLIDAYLSGEGKNSRHTMLFCDLDDFKSVNDTFGHPFGDALLSSVADKFSQTFRREDILCRIGGDEFVVLMKNASGRSYVSHRANLLLDHMKQALDLGDHRVTITMSVGIASYPEGGSTYSELLQNADKAMYVSKFNGKNQYYFYDDTISGNSGFTGTKDDEEKESFADARSSYKTRGKLSDYIFNCLYESTDIEKTMSLVLQLMGTHFELGRVAIAEFFDDKLLITRQWNANGIKTISSPVDYSGELRALFEGSRSCEYMTLRYSDFNQAPADVRHKLIEAGIDDVHAFMHCPLLDDGVIRGYIVFFDCKSTRDWSEEERDTLSYVSRLISLFVFKRQAHQRTMEAYELASQALDGSPLTFIVINPDTYEIKHLSNRATKSFQNAEVGKLCYQSIYGNDRPCDFCPVQPWKDGGRTGTYIHERYIESLDEWFVFSATGITTSCGHGGCLCGRVSTTQYKDKEKELEAENAMLRAQLAELNGRTNTNNGGFE